MKRAMCFSCAAWLICIASLLPVSRASIIDLVNTTSAASTYGSGYTTPTMTNKTASVTTLNTSATITDGSSEGYTEPNYIFYGPWSVSATSSNQTTSTSNSFSNDALSSIEATLTSPDNTFKGYLGYSLTSTSTFQVDATGTYLVTAGYGFGWHSWDPNSGSYSLKSGSTTIVSGTTASDATNNSGYSGDLTLSPGNVYTLTVSVSSNDAADGNYEVGGGYNYASSALASVTPVPEPAALAGVICISVLLIRRRPFAHRMD